MIPDPWIVTLLYFVGYALAGAALGAFTGILATRVLKLRIRGIIKDCFLGSFGFLLGLFAVGLNALARENTVSYHTDGGTLASSTMNRYQHPVESGNRGRDTRAAPTNSLPFQTGVVGQTDRIAFGIQAATIKGIYRS